MRVGLVSYWFNRGQATVARQLRGALESLGHETFVLARPTKASFQRPAYIARHDVWDQAGVTHASHFTIPGEEYLEWADANDLEVVLCDQNYQFDEIEALRARGVRTLGRFVWEDFREDDADGARRAFDVIYSLTRCEQARYATLGIDSPFVPWGCHPEWSAVPRRTDPGSVTFLFPGGYLSRRKPLGAVLAAFAAVDDPALRLVVKVQGVIGGDEELVAARASDRVTIISGDLPARRHRELMASTDVCVAPSRWEGLGLHLYEATALGLPTITIDRPPMNEVVHHEDNGLLVGAHEVDPAPSGIPAYDPDTAALSHAIARLAEARTRESLRASTLEASRGRLSWEHTVHAVGDLVGAA